MATLAPLNVEKIREDFPILKELANGKPLVYFDNAATSQKPRAVISVLDEYWETYNANVHRGVHALSQKATAEFDAAREATRRFLNAAQFHEVIFTKGCTESVNLVAQCYGREKLKPGDEVLISAMEHHSNIVPWQLACERTGATLKVIPISDDGEIDLDVYAGLLSEKTKIVAVNHVSNALGTVNPIKKMIAMAHDAGAVVLIDGAQAGPHLPIDVQDLDADFYTLSCHKMYSPTGVGVLYGKEALLDAMPPYQGGGDMIYTVTFEKTTYAPLPAKFEAGTPHIAGVIGTGAAIQYMEKVGREAIAEHERALVDYAHAQLETIDGVRVFGPKKNRAGVVSFAMKGAHPHDIGTILDSEGIAIRAGHHCCMPLMKRLGVPATARASFAMYNTEAEIDVLVKGVLKVKELFA